MPARVDSTTDLVVPMVPRIRRALWWPAWVRHALRLPASARRPGRRPNGRGSWQEEADGWRCAQLRPVGWWVVRCPRCGAANPDGADWCGQCLMRFGTPIPLVTPPRPGGTGRQGPGPELPEGASGADGATSAPARPPDLGQTVAVRLVPSPDGRIRRVGDRLEWVCPACEGVNAIDELTCRVCGNPILDLFRLSGPPVASRRTGVALGLSVVPGLGCWYAGSLGQGLARLLLAGSWLAVLVAVWPRPGPAMLVVAFSSSSGRLGQDRGSPGGGSPSSGQVPPGGPAGPGQGAR